MTINATKLPDMPSLTREISRRRQPPAILRLLMGALEARRQAAGLGWSRPWNKLGLTVFATHVLDRVHDQAVIDAARAHLGGQAFVDELFADPGLMVFVFYHDRVVEDVRYEGLTLSFGRRVAADRRRRDRVDLVLEDRCEAGGVDGAVDLARLIVNPWSEWKNRAVQQTELEPASVQRLYAECLSRFHEWQAVPERQWRHWSIDYIDYFGDRSSVPEGSRFS